MKKLTLKKNKNTETKKETPTKAPFSSFMKKEIFTQSELLKSMLLKFIKADKIDFDFLKIHPDKIKRIYITADSTLFGCVISAGYNFEVLADLPCVPILLSEFNCSNPILDKNTLVIILAQSNTEHDVMTAKKRCDISGAKALFILDRSDALDKSSKIISLDYESMALFPTASYTAKYLLLCLVALYFGEKNKIVTDLYINIATKMFLSLCGKVKNINECDYYINTIAGQIAENEIILTGRNVDFSTAFYGETALNFLAGMRAKAIPSGELQYYKSDNAYLIAFISNRELMRQTLSDIESFKDNTVIIAPNALAEDLANYKNIIAYTDSIPLLNPIISSAVVELLFYNIAKIKKLPTDKTESLNDSRLPNGNTDI